MEMGSKKEVKAIEPKGEVYECPSCGYHDGFHISFRWDPEGKEGEIHLVCPNCHSRFRIGWWIPNPSKAEENRMSGLNIHSY
jgi:predicted RNA-binding Zn-ribbon protein involved in translation (DUF1610 family)